MRILIVTDQFPPVTFGGMAQHAWHIAHKLGERHAVYVLVPRSQKADWGKVPFDVSPSLSIRFPVLDVISILKAAREFKAEVIHVCNAALSYRLVSRYYPTVTRVVGNDFLRPWCGYGLPLRSLLYRLPGHATKVRVKALETRIRKSKTTARLQQVDAVAANSEWTREQLIAEGVPESHVFDIVGGVDTTVFQPAAEKSQARGEIGLLEDGLVILTAAELVRKKGIDTVLRAVAELAPKWPSLRYVIVGDGEDETYLRDLASDLGVGDRVIFAGRKTQMELCRYYQAADVYVQVSRNHRFENGYLDVETMGRTYMEAGACGLPVVAAKVGGVPSVVIDNVNGLLVEDPQDQDEIAAAIDQLLENEDLRLRMGQAGLEMAREEFSWERVTAAFEEVMVVSVPRSGGDAVRISKSEPPEKNPSKVPIKTLIGKARAAKYHLSLPTAARKERKRDLARGLMADPGIERSVTEAIAWLCRAQDHSTTKDGGVASHYSLISGWASSYPETTGYIIPTFIAFAEKYSDEEIMMRARRMLNWLLKIQFPDGAFQGGRVDSRPIVPVTFNTGQILLGLSRGAAKFGEPYLESMHRAAQWLVNTQDRDGCWRKHPSPFVAPGEKTYETHVAWSLLEAARVGYEEKYVDAALRNIRWSLTKQHSNGWFEDCCVIDPSQPLTHTIGYAVRGVLEAYRYKRDISLLNAAYRTGDGLLSAVERNGFLPGRLDKSWRGTVSWACLTGSVQIAYCWLLLYLETDDDRFRDAAFLVNEHVRRTVTVDQDTPETRGAVKASFPVHGDYMPYVYLNWAAKFFIDSNMLEHTVRGLGQ